MKWSIWMKHWLKQTRQTTTARMKINVTQEAILSLRKDAQNVLRFPENRKWDSKDKDARFKSLFRAFFCDSCFLGTNQRFCQWWYKLYDWWAMAVE